MEGLFRLRNAARYYRFNNINYYDDCGLNVGDYFICVNTEFDDLLKKYVESGNWDIEIRHEISNKIKNLPREEYDHKKLYDTSTVIITPISPTIDINKSTTIYFVRESWLFRDNGIKKKEALHECNNLYDDIKHFEFELLQNSFKNGILDGDNRYYNLMTDPKYFYRYFDNDDDKVICKINECIKKRISYE